MLQLFFFYFFFPLVLKIKISVFVTVILTFVLNYAAYLAEIYRGGINSVDKGQHEAAFALGLTKKQTMLDIILPQTMKAVLPPIVNEAITLVKDTALASSLPLVDLMKATNSSVNRMTDITPMFFSALIYLLNQRAEQADLRRSDPQGRDRHGVPALQPVPTHDLHGERYRCADQGQKAAEGGGAAPWKGAA